MSCSINRFKFVGNAATKPNTDAAKELDARMKDLMAMREAQDHGDFKFRPGFTSPPFTITPVDVNTSIRPNRHVQNTSFGQVYTPDLATQPSATQHAGTTTWPQK